MLRGVSFLLGQSGDMLFLKCACARVCFIIADSRDSEDACYILQSSSFWLYVVRLSREGLEHAPEVVNCGGTFGLLTLAMFFSRSKKSMTLEACYKTNVL